MDPRALLHTRDGLVGSAGAAVLPVVVSLCMVMTWLLVAPAVASAASETVNCAGLQEALNQAVNGDTITLTKPCTGSAFTLPATPSAAMAFTLTGKPGSGAGFDGTGAGGSILTGNESSALVHLTVSHLTFKSGTAGSFGGAIYLQGDYGLTLQDDAFTNNQAPAGGGGAVVVFTTGSSASVSIQNSTFQGNGAEFAGGAVELEGEPGIPISLSGNTFSGNSVTNGSADLVGGAAYIMNQQQGLEPLTQTDNRFTGNSITGGPADANGGAEATLGMTLSSTADVFTGNSLRAAPSGHFSEGAALSIENNDCNTSHAPAHVLRNLVIAGNSITDGGAAGSAHGALYVGCGENVPLTGNNLTLINSTISGNRGGGGTAGIYGDPIDQLTLKNSILARDSDGTELTGFDGTGGSLAVSFTDLCQGAAPFAGTGNICADPRLVAAALGNVHETYSSPTIDRGSNALVPVGLTEDVYGRPRIAAKLAGHTARVDMGAAELPTIAAPRVTIRTPASGAVYRRGQTVHSSFTCAEGAGGPGIASCRDGNGRPSGALISTSTVGQHTFRVSAISKDGLRTTRTISYTVKRG